MRMVLNQTRRDALRSAALMGTSTALLSRVGTARDTVTATVRSEGIQSRATELAHAGELRQLSRLLDQYSIPNELTRKEAQPDRVRKSIKTRTSVFNDGEKQLLSQESNLSTQDEWDKDDSSFNRATYYVDKSEDLWETVFEWDLGDGGDAGEGQFESNTPHDGIQISFSTNDWDHNSIAAEARPKWDPDRPCSCSAGSDIEEKSPHGIGAIYDDPNNPYFEDILVNASGSARTQMYRTDDERPHTLYGTYKHTWSTVNVTGVSFGMKNTPISIGVGADVYSWNANVDHIVKPNDEVVTDRY